MSVSLKNKILQYETAPPAGTWDRLSLQLDEEFSAVDSILSSRLENTIVEPPRAVWDNIVFALDNVEEKKAPAKVIPMVFKRIAVAAVLLGAISLITVYLLNNNNDISQPAEVSNNPGPNLESFIPSNNQGRIG
ncbi:MAG: hypothetical protein J7497_14110, partial [Chitinophagaceae bacterium]|nr:hypothetical protein [Chitinophagaceae bacterium]